MSHRYGQRVLPSEIDLKTYIHLKSECSNLDLSFDCEIDNKKIELKNLIEDCYALDENEIPNKYKFLEASTIFHGFKHKVPNSLI